MEENPQGGPNEASNKRNRRKKKNKTPDANDSVKEPKRGAPFGDAEQNLNNPRVSTPIQGNGRAGKTTLLPAPVSYDQGQHMDRGNRNVEYVKRRGAENEANSNSNANNARYRDRGKPRADRKSSTNTNRQTKEKEWSQDSPVSHKGCFTKLEGKELLRKLAEHRIFELRKKNPSFPNAKYFCRLCEYHLDRPQDCERHVDENRHQRKKEALDMEGILENIPRPSGQQVRALDSVVHTITQQEGLSPADLESRRHIVHRLQTFVKKFRDDVKLEIYGSSVTGVGRKVSDVNVDVSGPGPAPALLLNVFRILQENGAPDFVNTRSSFSAKIPVVEVTESRTGCQIVLTINAQAAVLTGDLLRLYMSADPRVKPLAVTLRTWARICHLDRQEEGMLPAFAFHILVVYFLQQVKPPVLCLLPLLQSPPEGKGLPPLKMEEKLDIEALEAQAGAWRSENGSSVGELWLELLRFYCLGFDNTQFVISLLHSQPLTRQEKKWNSKKLAIEDPFNPKKNIANSLANSLIFEYYQSCVRKAYEYFGMPRDRDGKVNVCLESLRALASQKTETLLKENQQDSSPSSSSVDASDRGSPQKEKAGGKAEESAEEESVDEQAEDSVVVQPNQTALQSLEACQKTDADKTASTEDSALSSSLSSALSSGSRSAKGRMGSTASTEDSALSSSLSSALSSGSRSAKGRMGSTASTEDSALSSSLSSALSSGSLSLKGRMVSESFNETFDAVDSSGLSSSEPKTGSAAGVPDVDTLDSAADVSALSVQDMSTVSREYFSAVDTVEGESSEEDYETSPETPEEETAGAVPALSKEMGQLTISDKQGTSQQDATAAGACVGGESEAGSTSMSLPAGGDDDDEEEDDDEGGVVADWYTFTERVFTGGKGPAVICGYCEQEGHIKGNCPEDRLPALVALPPMNHEHLIVMEKVIGQIIYDFAPSEPDMRKRHRAVKDLESFVQQIYPDAEFALFGSTCNGFGFHRSDLDICMTFRGKTVEDIDVVDIIECVAKKLTQKSRLYYNVVPIPTAKVPIVKFTEGETRLEGDISLYNTLAQCNTRLLRCYSEIDKRVKILGYAVKIFAKLCEIGDASRGSLSSYGYILMMIHYLQQCRPPVIPVLQELLPKGQCPELMVEGCNTWFFSDLRRLEQVWRDCGKNGQGLAELWVGFLRYYLEHFDWKTMVVSIRQSAPLSKFEKMWNGNTIAVEDPFDLTHNLGGGLSRKMNNYIYKTFVKGRMHFGTPVHYKRDLMRRYPTPADYFFDPQLLMDGKPPNDRGCRMCGKIGHMVKDCPNRSQNRRRQQSQNNQESKETNNQRKSGKEAKGQSSSQTPDQSGMQVKGQSKGKDREQEGGQVKGQKEWRDSRTKSAEKASDAPADQDKAWKNQTGRQTQSQTQTQTQTQTQSQSQAGSRPDFGPKHSEENKGAKRKEKARQAPSEARAAAAPSAYSRVFTNSSSTAPTAVAPPSTVTTNSATGPPTPVRTSTPQRKLPRSDHSGALPSPVQAGPDPPLSRRAPSTPAHPTSPGLTPPGVQMNLQQLFTMAQHSGPQPVMPQEVPKQPALVPGLHPRQLNLTPEQQVALLGTPTNVKAKASGGSGSSGWTSKGSPDPQMTPVSVTALFQAQSPTSLVARPPHFPASPQPRMPLPLTSLFSAHSPSPRQASGSSPAPQSPRSGSGVSGMSMTSPAHGGPPTTGPQQMTSLPVKNLFPSNPPSQQGSASRLASQTPGSGSMATSTMSPIQNVPGSNPQQMTPVPLKTLFSSKSPRPTGGTNPAEARLPNHPNQPVSLRYLFQQQLHPQQQLHQQQQLHPQQQQMMLQQQQQAFQSQMQFQQAQFLQNLMQQQQQEQKQAGGKPGTQSAANASQPSAHSSVTTHPPGFQPFFSHPHTMTQLSTSQHHNNPPREGPPPQSQPDRAQRHNSGERGRDQASGFPQNVAGNEAQMSHPRPHPDQLQQPASSAHNPVSAFMQRMSTQSQPVPILASSVPPSVGPGHPLSFAPHGGQTLSSSPLSPHHHHHHQSMQSGARMPPGIPPQQSQPSLPEGGPMFMQSPYSHPMAMPLQQNQPMMGQPGGDPPASPLPSWPPGVDPSADPLSLQQQHQLSLMQQQLMQQQQQQFAAALQGVVGYGQSLPGQAAPGMMGPHGLYQMGPGAQHPPKERRGSSSSQDTTG